MIQPAQVVKAAQRKEKENERFCLFLKNEADLYELDRQFMRLHKGIFPYYDCNRCRNCCRLLHAEIPREEIDRDAALLKMSREDFISAYLERDDFGDWMEKHLPCGFLSEDGNCKLGDYRPDSCKKFPYTDQPERLLSLHSVLTAVSVCPAAYEIFDALKKEYGFPSQKNRKRRNRHPQEENSDFSFITGYPSWGFPYGVNREEEDRIPSDEPPF